MDTPTEGTPTMDTPTMDTPTMDTPTEGTPTMDTPTEGTPTMDTPTEGTPTMDTPTEGTPTMDKKTATEYIAVDRATVESIEQLKGKVDSEECDPPLTNIQKKLSVVNGSTLINKPKFIGPCTSSAFPTSDHMTTHTESESFNVMNKLQIEKEVLEETNDGSNDEKLSNGNEKTKTHLTKKKTCMIEEDAEMKAKFSELIRERFRLLKKLGSQTSDEDSDPEDIDDNEVAQQQSTKVNDEYIDYRTGKKLNYQCCFTQAQKDKIAEIRQKNIKRYMHYPNEILKKKPTT